ncbi:hypothetical protein [Pseudomonas sp. LY10J]|uniref:hypothetical protein n=1 Tax=Pseudomonas sp. LY10J TaxID=2787783 RepID=UPI001438E981|nr:hypothetical protein [Pseudomonas sp. LY10J]
MQRNKEVVVIMIKPNELMGDDILRVGLRKENGEQLSMTLPSPHAVAARNAPRPSALLGLPNELLLQITANTGNNEKGVNLSLRQVNKQMKDIADEHLSQEQRFFAQHAQTLSDSGYGRTSKKDLLKLNTAQQHFALTNGPTLRATAGYDGFTINDLAESRPAVQHFALTHGPTLRATTGYDGESINDLAKSSPAARNFALTQGPWLHTHAGYNGYDINGLSRLLPAYQQSALAHGAALHTRSGYTGENINFFATLTPSQQQFALTNGPRLHAEGYSSGDINLMAMSQR